MVGQGGHAHGAEEEEHAAQVDRLALHLLLAHVEDAVGGDEHEDEAGHEQHQHARRGGREEGRQGDLGGTQPAEQGELQVEQAAGDEHHPAHPHRQGEGGQAGEQGQENEKFEHGISP